MPDLTKKVALITGANRGQGKVIAQHFDALGANVVVGARNLRDAIDVEETLENDALSIQLNVTDEDDWKYVIQKAVKTFGKIDILVNNAGIYLNKPFLETTLASYKKLIQTNQIGTFLGMQYVAKQMKVQLSGSIINTVSVSSFSPIHESSLYASTKAAVTTMSKAAAMELGDYGIRVNMVHPGGVNTGMFSDSNEGNEFYEQIPLKRIGQPMDIAQAVAFLASDESAYCTGTEIVVDGGMTLGTTDHK